MTRIIWQDIMSEKAVAERAKLDELEAKRRKRRQPTMTEREKTSNATKGLIPQQGKKGVTKVSTRPFADIYEMKDCQDNTAHRRLDSKGEQRFG